MLKAILIGGLIAGALDMAYAMAVYGAFSGAQPFHVMQSPAGGLLGREAARNGGWPTLALGQALHFSITIAMAAAYVIASRVLPILLRAPLIFGPLYGALLFVIMNYVVLPSSALHAPLPELGSKGFWIAVVAHCVLVGPAIAFVASAMLKPRARA